MRLKLIMLVYCQFCIGMFAQTQDRHPAKRALKIENGADALPVTVSSSRKMVREKSLARLKKVQSAKSAVSDPPKKTKEPIDTMPKKRSIVHEKGS